MDYSKTVNLPRTPFPMKADLPNREPNFQKFWEQIGLYGKMIHRDCPRGQFILHDGPPYSNGDIHMGHALNKSLKDFVVRYKSMRGYRAPLIPGWDNHGMPIENKVTQEFRRKKESPERTQLRRACREYAAHWVDKQREQMKRLGVVADWDNPYLTMSREYEATIIKVFGELAEQGYIYRGLKPIHWCITDETALAEAEIEYEEHTSHSIYVRFPLVKDPNGVFGNGKNGYTIIWTTTPWTIPANLAVAVHPGYDYSFVDVDGSRYLIASELVGRTMAAIGAETYCVAKTVKGAALEGMVFRHPIYDRESILVHADYVTLEEGTGVVHTAPGHGREDFDTGRKYGLKPLCPVNEKGYFTDEALQFAGLHITKQGNEAVMQALADNEALLHRGQVAHSYPHCWRCHNPLVFRTTEQWFLRLDHNGLRRKILDQIVSAVTCYPPEGRNRLYAMIEGSPDWCLSRQRSWGVGIPVVFCRSCREPLLSKEIIDRVYEDALANGSDSWFEKDVSEFLPPDLKCPKCGAAEFAKEDDVLDVWFDSGSSCRAVTERAYESFIADVYLEGSDQHRGWFNKSIIVGTATRGASPFKDLVTHGYVLDAEGKKMSKSGGNAIAPKEVIKHIGADILRLYVSSLNYFEDVRFGQEMFTRATDAYRRIRNTFRFMLGNISDFDPAADAVPYAELEELDRFMLHRLAELIEQVTKAYDAYEFHRVYQAVHNFCAVDLSALYLDILKDRLYASARTARERRSAQTVLYQLTSVLARILAPVLVHTAEEVWQELPEKNTVESVHLASFPEAVAEWVDERLAERWQTILDVRDRVLLKLEEARQSGVIGKPLESKVKLTAGRKLYNELRPYAHMLPGVFIVSQVELVEGEEDAVEVSPPDGRKCARCWLVLESVGRSSTHPELCDRCAAAIE